MNFRDWPIGGAAVALFLVVAIGFAAWYRMPTKSGAAAAKDPPPAPSEVAFDRDHAFSEFHARSQGLPMVRNIPLPLPNDLARR